MVQEATETTAIVALEKDMRSYGEVLRIQEAVTRARDIAMARVVVNLVDAKGATDDLAIMATTKKNLEALRQGYVRPLQGQVKDINDFFKLISQPLEEANKVTRDKVLAFKEKQDQIRLVAENAARLQREADEAANEVKQQTGEMVAPRAEADVVVPTTTPLVHTQMGTSGVTRHRKFEIMNQEEIPRLYMMPNLKKIGDVIRSGGEIPGVRGYEEKTLRVTAKKERENG